MPALQHIPPCPDPISSRRFANRPRKPRLPSESMPPGGNLSRRRWAWVKIVQLTVEFPRQCPVAILTGGKHPHNHAGHAEAGIFQKGKHVIGRRRRRTAPTLRGEQA